MEEGLRECVFSHALTFLYLKVRGHLRLWGALCDFSSLHSGNARIGSRVNGEGGGVVRKTREKNVSRVKRRKIRRETWLLGGASRAPFERITTWEGAQRVS